MAHARRGRPRKSGPRNASGRLISVPDRGNMRVVARSLAFARFQGGQADQQIVDQIGRVWAAGLLDGHGCDGAILRDVGRRYAGVYWHQFAALAPKTMQWERRDRSTAEGRWEDHPGDLFQKLDEAAHRAGREAVAAMHALCVDGWWFPDIDAGWLERLIRSAVKDAGGPTEGAMASVADRGQLQAAAAALVAMTQG